VLRSAESLNASLARTSMCRGDRRDSGAHRAPAAVAQVAPIPAEVFPLAGVEINLTYHFPDAPAREGGPASGTTIVVEDVAVTSDGSLLVPDFVGVIRRIDLDGTVTDLAGTSPMRGLSDTPARRTELHSPYAVAALRDESFLLVEGFRSKARRVWPDGSIRIVARRVFGSDIAALPDGSFVVSIEALDVVRRFSPGGRISRFAGKASAPPDYGGDGGPATAARLASPTGVDATPEGVVLIADTDNHRVRRVDTRGIIETAARVRSPNDVAAAPDGGFFVSTYHGIRRYAANGSLVGHFSTRAPDFAGRRLYPTDLAVLPDGNVAFVADQRLWLLRVAPSQRLAVSLRNLHVSGNTLTVTFSATAPGTATVRTAGRDGSLSVSAPVIEGTNRVTVAGPFVSAKRWVRVRLQDAAGRVAHDRIGAWLGPVLRTGVARRLVEEPLDADEGGGNSVGRCRRFSRRRVDCEVRYRRGIYWRGEDRYEIVEDRCDYVASVTLPPTGILQQRTYRCRKGPTPFRKSLRLH